MSDESGEHILLLDDWRISEERSDRVKAGIETLVAPGCRFILVDDDGFGFGPIGGRIPLPFLERDGVSWGSPADSATAIAELERIREEGAAFIAFAPPAFWWLRHYADFQRHLCSRYPCRVHRAKHSTVDLIAFDLRRGPSEMHHPRRAPRITVLRRLVPEQELTARYREAVLSLVTERGAHQLGEYLEFGVYVGSSMACMDHVLKDLGCDHVRLLGFDSFEGLPGEASSQAGGWLPGQFECGIELTRQYLTEAGVDMDRVVLSKGWFSDILTPDLARRLAIEKASVIMVDCDLYSSALQALRFCAPLIRDEAVIFFDDWNSGGGLAERDLGEKRAFSEFLAEQRCFEVSDFDAYAPRAAAFRIKRTA